MKKNRFWSVLKEYFLLGLISIFPIVLTFWILKTAVSFLDRKFYDMIPWIDSPNDFFGFYIPGLGIVLTILVLLVAGLIAKTIAGKVLKRVLESWLGRVPVVRGLYRAANQIGSVFFSAEPSAFKKVVYVPFPYAGAKAIAFVTSHGPDGKSFVYVPTAPNPTSGYILLYNDDDIEEASMTVEEALQFVISGGVVLPGPVGASFQDGAFRG